MVDGAVSRASGPPRLREVLDSGTLHFMGIGGAGMCALAEALVREGGRVTGCDMQPSPGVRPLEELGVRVQVGHHSDHVENIVGLIVSSAIPADHPELRAAIDAGIPVWKRAEALGHWVDSGTVVAVAGTHGKTTTTAMITEILVRAGMDPTGFVGGWMPAWQSHLRAGRDDLFVVEADEYDRSFHHLRPNVAVVTNMDADHLDIYGDLAGVRAGFVRFLEGVREGGGILACADDPGASSLLAAVSRSGRTFGFSAGAQLRGVDFEATAAGSLFRVFEDGRDRGRARVRVLGRHNASNALAAMAAARRVGVEWQVIFEALSEFSGVHRRFETLGSVAGVTVVDDYAHHPKELDAALSAARTGFPGGRLVAVFQPHLYTRTRDLAEEFGAALAAADEVWVTEVYPAREAPLAGVDGGLVAREVRKALGNEGPRSKAVHFHADLDTLPEVVASELRSGDVCVTLGAGSIERVGPEVLRRLEGGSGEGHDG